MAFPIFRGASEAYTSTEAVSLTVSKPTGTINGDLAILIMSIAANVAFSELSIHSSWVSIVQNEAHANRVYVWYKVLDGTEGTTITVSWASGVESITLSMLTYEKDTHDGEVFAGPTSYNNFNATNSFLSITAPWGNADNIMLGIISWMANYGLSTPPANVTERISVISTGGVNNRVYAYSNNLTSSSYTFGNFTLSSTTNTTATGLVIKPILSNPTAIETNIGGVYKTGEVTSVNIGGVWKDVESLKINIGGVWKTVGGAGWSGTTWPSPQSEFINMYINFSNNTYGEVDPESAENIFAAFNEGSGQFIIDIYDDFTLNTYNIHEDDSYYDAWYLVFSDDALIVIADHTFSLSIAFSIDGIVSFGGDADQWYDTSGGVIDPREGECYLYFYI